MVVALSLFAGDFSIFAKQTSNKPSFMFKGPLVLLLY